MSATTPFVVKNFLDIIAAMIAHSRATTDRVTDYNVGSVARTLLEAPAIEVDALYQAMFAGLTDAIPTAIYEGFGFAPLPAQAASGYAQFTLAVPRIDAVLIPARTVIRNPLSPIEYETQADATIPAGGTQVIVAIAATTAGSASNAIPDTLTAYLPVVAGVSVTNPESILGGADAETATQRRARFLRYIQSLARGTVASLEYAASQGVVYSVTKLPIERTARAAVDETAGHVDLYIYNGVGNTTTDLIADVQRRVDGYFDEDSGLWVPGYRPAGMRVDVKAMTEVEVDVSIEVEAVASWRGTGFQAQIIATIGDAIRLPRAEAILRPIEIVNAVLALSGVDGCRIVSPTQSIAIAAHEALVPGAITVTWI